MYVCGLVHAMAHLRSEDNVQESSLPTMWVLGIKLRLLGLTASTYTDPSVPTLLSHRWQNIHILQADDLRLTLVPIYFQGRSQYVVLAALELRNPSASLFQVLGLKMFTTKPNNCCLFNLNNPQFPHLKKKSNRRIKIDSEHPALS